MFLEEVRNESQEMPGSNRVWKQSANGRAFKLPIFHSRLA